MLDAAPAPKRRKKDAKPERDLSEVMSGLISRLDSEAQRRVARRRQVEERWLQDLQQYHGRYSETMREKLVKSGRSQVYFNLTRSKSNAMIARLWDLLFPTDDRNWGIQPTPVPSLTESAENALQLAADAEKAADEAGRALEQAGQTGDEEQIMAAAGDKAEAEEVRDQARKAAHALEEQLAEARRRAELMQLEIDDQLKTCNYQAEARDAISDAVKIGMGVLKGPVTGLRPRRRFVLQAGQYTLTEDEGATPAAYWVDPWGFFPDPDARRMEDSPGNYERHLMSPTMLRRLAKRPDIDADAIRALLRLGPQGASAPTYLVDLHNLTGQDVSEARDLFHVWEYRGPLDAEDFAIMASALGDEELMKVAVGEGEPDPLMEVQAVVWFCQGKLLSLALDVMDSGDPIYSVFNVEKDEASLFGYGLPYLMRDEQAILNSARRAMMDNAALATAPQIIVDRKQIMPEDGNWHLTPGKTWIRVGPAVDGKSPAFEAQNIPMAQAELANILEMTRRDVDEVTGLPALAQGEQGGVTKTAQGMALLMNSANVVFRRVVKNWDDDVTVPLLKRFYHFNMQFSDKAEIKGDYDVDARGSSVLLVREMQATNLLTLAQMFGQHPMFAPMIKPHDLLRAICRAFMLPEHEIMLSERETEQAKKEAMEQPDPATQAQMAQAEALKAEVQIKQQDMELRKATSEMEADVKLRIAQMEYDSKMSQVAEALNMKREDLAAKMETASMTAAERSRATAIKTQSDERKLAVEVAMAERTGKNAGGSV